jgi:hypothetical protein
MALSKRRTYAFGICAALLQLSCGKSQTEPPPPAASVDLPSGAPGATGALAAGRTTAPAPEDEEDPLDDEDEEDPPLLPSPADPLAPVPSGTGEPGVNL